jgi:hypothetical protein
MNHTTVTHALILVNTLKMLLRGEMRLCTPSARVVETSKKTEMEGPLRILVAIWRCAKGSPRGTLARGLTIAWGGQ